MKKQLFRYLTGILPSIALFASLNAQTAKTAQESFTENYLINDAKVNIPALDDGNTVLVNPRALSDFRRNYKSVGDARWIQIKHGFLAKFKADAVETRVFYDPHGRWSSTILTYAEDKLPAHIRSKVKSTYYDYTIYLVHEITIGDNTVYLVSMQDKTRIKTIRVTDENMDEYEELTKL